MPPRRYTIALPLLWLVFASAASAQTTVTLQQSVTYSGASDNWVICCDSANTNFGTNNEVDMRAASDFGLFRFAIFQSEGGVVPDNMTINSATLSIYKSFGPDAVFKASRVLKPWTETGSTWNSTGTGAAWSSPGAQALGSDILGTADGQGSAPDSGANNCADGVGHDICWLSIDVTASVRAFANGTASNYGWLVQQVSSSGEFTYKDFISKDATSFTQYRPKLTVTYSPPPPVEPVTLQQSATYSGATDNWIICCDSANTNFGTNNEVDMRAASDFGLFRFAIFQSEGGVVPDNMTINSATLSIYKSFGPDAVFKASRVLKPWTETGSTWNSTGTGAAWSSPGAQALGSDILGTADGQGSAPDSGANNCADGVGHDICWLSIDVTASVRAFANGTASNYGWLVQQVSSSGEFTYKDFISKDATSFTQYRPKLTVSYGRPCDTSPVASLAATPASGDSPLTVTFDASASADGNPPISGLTLDYGDGNQVTWTNKAQTQAHTYSTAASTANFTATLTARNSCGSSRASKTITVNGTPGPIALAGRAVATFHSVGVYWDPPADSVPPPKTGVPIRYQSSSDSVWHRGYDLVYDTRAFVVDGLPLEKARGSIVNLDPGVTYVVQFGRYDTAGNVTWLAQTQATTWSERFPEQDTTVLPAAIDNGATGNSPALSIASGGSATTGYKVYDGALNRTVITANTTQSGSFGIEISASYVIVRNVTVVGGMDGIRIDDTAHHVVIEGCDIQGWGSPRGDAAMQPPPYSNNPIGANEQAGIRTTPGNSTSHRGIKQLVIQRNRIHDPHFSANFRPNGADGPKAIDMVDTGGNNVIRYNEIFATNGDSSPAHWFQDGISGSTNDSQQGAPGQDSDIYMNRIQHSTDDCIEAEGGGMNVRVWKNYTDMCAIGIASTAVEIGPTYIFRNVNNRSRQEWGKTWDADERGQAYKSGTFSNTGGGNGRRYLFHNTVMEYEDATLGRLGHAGGVEGNSDPTNLQPVTNTVSRNNIYLDRHVGGSPFAVIDTTPDVNDFDYDVAENYAGAPPYSNALSGTPVFQTGNGPAVFDGGMYQLAPGTPGYDQGKPLFNFNDDMPAPYQFLGTKPDAGAHEAGAPRMVFGVGASGS